MVVFLVLFGTIHLAGVLIVLFAVAKAPFGYEDEEGFHQSDAEGSTPTHPAA